MTSQLKSKPEKNKSDLINLLILISVAAIIGIYLIATTVLISKDGVFYIERAQQFASNPFKIIKAHPPGYPFMILMAHKFVALFTNSTSNQTWIYSAQAITLLCRLLSLIPLYFIGKLLVGPRNSFWAILILIFLPFPAKAVCDVVREWPYLLFLSIGFLFLLWAIKCGKWWAFGIVGFSCSLGYLIRNEGAQLIVYGSIWVAISIFRPKLWKVSRLKNILALLLLLIGFAIPAVPYMKCSGKILPYHFNCVIKAFSLNNLPEKTDASQVKIVHPNYNTAEIVTPKLLKALSDIFRAIGKNLMWFFMLPLIIGLYYRFRGQATKEERFLITAFVIMSVVMMCFRYCYKLPVISKRWTFPLVSFTVFYIPIGFRILARWLCRCDPKKSSFWFHLLVVIGIAICIGKLTRISPLRWEKQGYIEASQWLKDNSRPQDIIAVPDRRFYFYAERKGFVYTEKVSKIARYVVRIEKNENEKPEFGIEVQKEYSVWVDERKKKKRIVIYEKL